MMGMSVPRAVVVRAMATAIASSSLSQPVEPGGEHEGEGERDGHGPGEKAALALGSGEALRVDLVAGQEEQESQAQIGQEAHRVGDADDVGHVRAEQRAGDEQKHRLGNSLLGMSFATMGLAAAVSAMMASETRSEVMEVCAFR